MKALTHEQIAALTLTMRTAVSAPELDGYTIEQLDASGAVIGVPATVAAKSAYWAVRVYHARDVWWAARSTAGTNHILPTCAELRARHEWRVGDHYATRLDELDAQLNITR